MKAIEALNKLCKWRTVLTGWHLGTQSSTAPGVKAMRDLQDARLIMRAEITALTRLLIEKGVFTVEDYDRVLALEAVELDKMLEQKFPGYKTTHDGLTMDVAIARDTHGVLGFPP